MPYHVVKTENGYGVQNKDTGDYRSKDTSKEKAEAQMRLLEGVEHHTLKSRPNSDKTYRRMN